MKPSSLLCLALMTPLAATACGSDDGDGGMLEGEHYRYVVSNLDTSQDNKIDLDGNGRPDNKLGELLQSLSMTVDVQATVAEAVVRGSVLLLADLQTSSLSGASKAGFTVYLGDSATAMPAPCTDVNTLSTCGKHLQGTGSFNLAAASPRDSVLTGPIAGGTFKGGPGKLALQLALSGAPVTVNLVGARAELRQLGADTIGQGLFGGGITTTELDTVVLPAVVAQLKSVVDRDCGPESERVLSGGTCGRMPVGGSFTACVGSGATALGPLLGLDNNRDCKITLAELKAFPLVTQSLTPDLMINGQAAVSAVLGFQAKKAVFTP